MTDKETFGRSGTEAVGVGVTVFIFGNLNRVPVRKRFGTVAGAEGSRQASVRKVTVVDLDILNEVGWYAGKNGRRNRRGVIADKV